MIKCDECKPNWPLRHLKDIHLLERVQHQFARLFPDLRSLPYEDRLDKLGLCSLEERRNRADLIEVFEMIKGRTVYHSMATFLQHGRIACNAERCISHGKNSNSVRPSVCLSVCHTLVLKIRSSGLHCEVAKTL